MVKSSQEPVNSSGPGAAIRPSSDHSLQAPLSLEVYSFSDKLLRVPSRRGFALRDAIVASQPHGGTQLRHALSSLREQYDRIIVITNAPSHDRVPVRFDHDHAGWDLEARRPLRQKAMNQLGTIGSGNHYVDLFTDVHDRVWIGAHFGSRGFGHGVASWFLKAAGAKDGMEVELCVLSASSDLGEQYIRAMTLAGEYAYAGRDWVCDRVARLLGASILESVHNHHNFAWHEEHDGEHYWVVRKGATPAFPGQKGFVGGTMAEPAVILEGVESEESKLAMYSTIHGAGRVMGRREAIGLIDRKTGEVKRAPKITREMMDARVNEARVVLRGAGVERVSALLQAAE